MKRFVLLVLLLVSLALSTWDQSERLSQRPLALKLGPVPNAALLKAFVGEHRSLLAFCTVARVMFYFGSFFEENKNLIQKTPEYVSMFQHLQNAIRLDPYNLDAYYFSQAAFTWEIGHAADVNALLDHGMKYRTWDYQLPFYAGFNSAFFLKNYAAAARYMQVAAERSNNALFTNLATRYFHEAGESELGLVFLDSVAKGAKSSKVQKIYQLRKQALQAVIQIEAALNAYQETHGTSPADLKTLITAGYLPELPLDPYGGEFYLDSDGKVRSSSKFALSTAKDHATPEPLGNEN